MLSTFLLSVDDKGWLPLHTAAHFRRPVVSRLLVRSALLDGVYDTFIDARDAQMRTVLSVACGPAGALPGGLAGMNGGK